MSVVVAEALLRRARAMGRFATVPLRPSLVYALACARCHEVPHRAVTTACGHTHCDSCLPAHSPCAGCGRRGQRPPAPDVLVRALATRWWPHDARAADAADAASRLLRRRMRDANAALKACDEALHLFPDSHRILHVRCLTYAKLDMWRQALNDANALVHLRPKWCEGYFLRGLGFMNIGRPQEAIICFGISVALGKPIHATRKLVQQALVKLPQHGLKKPKKTWRQNYNRNQFETDLDSTNITDERGPNYAKETIAIKTFHDIIKKDIERIREIDAPPKISIDHVAVDSSDFECVLCYRTFWIPVTTPCGHTYCWQCLERCMDYNYDCPLCMTSLTPFFAEREYGVNEWTDIAVRLLLPTEYEARKLSHARQMLLEEREPILPVFICTTAFPAVPCPLFVFEPRYRLMVRRCLESGERRFGIVACGRQNGHDNYAEYGTILEIKDCVLMPDGCSILSTVGIGRFRVIARGEYDGYDVARIENIQDKPTEYSSYICDLYKNVRLKAMVWFEEMDQDCRDEIEQTFGRMPPEELGWLNLKDGPAWAWWVVAILPLDTRLKVMILATEDLEKRLRAIDRTLDLIYFLDRKKNNQTTEINITGQGQLNITIQYQQHYNPEPWLISATTSTSQLGEQSMSCLEEDGMSTDLAQDSHS